MKTIEIKLKDHGPTGIYGKFPKEFFKVGQTVTVEVDTGKITAPSDGMKIDTEGNLNLIDIKRSVKAELADFVTLELGQIIGDEIKKALKKFKDDEIPKEKKE